MYKKLLPLLGGKDYFNINSFSKKKTICFSERKTKHTSPNLGRVVGGIEVPSLTIFKFSKFSAFEQLDITSGLRRVSTNGRNSGEVCKTELFKPCYVFFLQEKMPNEMRHSIHAGLDYLYWASGTM
tara:strand:- start:25 stop:402 length:378 start_codon:yes stop_codon:yes gene_type:complete